MDPRTRSTIWVVAIAAVVVALVASHHITSDEVIVFCVIVPSIILHEVSHGWVAKLFGDDTAARAGRLTLNPIRHVDPFGTLIVPALMALSGIGVIGWAKPVPVNSARLRHPRNESVAVSLAGPLVNAVLAAGFSFWFATAILPGVPFGVSLSNMSTFDKVIFYAGWVNVVLCVFNLIPIPPLDGSAVFERLLPARWWPTYLRYRQYTLPLLIAIVLLNSLISSHPLTQALNHLFNWWAGLVGLS